MENTAREELESWALLLPTPVPFCITQNCLFPLPPNLFSPIYGIQTHLPGIFHEFIWSGNVGRAVIEIKRGFLKILLFLLKLVPPPTTHSTHCLWPEGNSAPSERITEQMLPQISLELSPAWAGISQRRDPSGDNRSNLSFVAAHLLVQTSSVLKQGGIFPLEDKKEKLPLIALYLVVAATFDSDDV